MQPMHTMRQFDMKEERGADGLHFVLAIRKEFTSQLPKMFSRLEQAISDEFSKELSDCNVADGMTNLTVPGLEAEID